MPKERRDRSVSIDKSRASPYKRPLITKNPLESEENLKEWEDARCPVCMEHPHNAILLLCSSHDKGCRPYMCDTSYRHSNCFDQFRKSFSESQIPSPTEETPKLMCPLCRGQVTGWVVVDGARLFMNTKTRSCASETCEFSGTYTDLRKHARLDHPLARPSEADPERQRDWRRMERQRDLGDLLSTLQSSIGEDRNEDIISGSGTTSALSFDEGGWLTVFFLIRVFRPGNNGTSLSGSSRARAQVTLRRRFRARLLGESPERESRDDENESSDDGSGGLGSGPFNLFQLSRRRPAPDNNNDES